MKKGVGLDYAGISSARQVTNSSHGFPSHALAGGEALTFSLRASTSLLRLRTPGRRPTIRPSAGFMNHLTPYAEFALPGYRPNLIAPILVTTEKRIIVFRYLKLWQIFFTY